MCKVVITIPAFVCCLRRMLRRWRSRASSSSDIAVPAGHVAVSVQGAAPSSSSSSSGPRRFAVQVADLGHPAFVELLRQAEEEFGFPAAPGPIVLPCDEDRFLDVLRRVSSSCCGRRGRGDARPLLRAGMAVENLVS